MLRSLFGNKSTSVITPFTPEAHKAVEDQLNSKERLLAVTSRQLEQKSRECRNVNEMLKLSKQKHDKMTAENKTQAALVDSLKQQIVLQFEENTRLATENNRLMALVQLQKNTDVDKKDGMVLLPLRERNGDVTAPDTISITATTNDTKSANKSTNKVQLCDQLRDVLQRGSHFYK